MLHLGAGRECSALPKAMESPHFVAWTTFLHQSFVFYLFIYFTILYWFCQTSTCIRHRCIRVSHPEPPTHLPRHTIPLGHPSAPSLSFLYPASNLDWWFISYMILYMFQCHSPKSSPPQQSPKDCSIHLCLFCCLTYRVIVTIFLNSELGSLIFFILQIRKRRHKLIVTCTRAYIWNSNSSLYDSKTTLLYYVCVLWKWTMRVKEKR